MSSHNSAAIGALFNNHAYMTLLGCGDDYPEAAFKARLAY